MKISLSTQLSSASFSIELGISYFIKNPVVHVTKTLQYEVTLSIQFHSFIDGLKITTLSDAIKILGEFRVNWATSKGWVCHIVYY